jgi:glycerate 2-kinase
VARPLFARPGRGLGRHARGAIDLRFGPSHTPPPREGETRTLLYELFAEAVRAVSAGAVMPSSLPAAAGGRLAAIAAGKAAADMMRVATLRSAGPLPGLVVTRYGHLPAGYIAPAGVELIEAGHPFPDDNSVRAGARALALARSLGSHDRLLVLLSGGGSALLAAPAPGISLAGKQALTRRLLACGAAIEEVNCVRKHLSRVKGGRLAVAAAPARVTTWMISDVPGDDPSFVASGPTLADPTTLEMARDVLARYGIVPPPGIARALADPENETPPVGAPELADAETLVLARGRDALAAGARLAADKGYTVTDLGDRLGGEARLLGASHAALARTLAAGGGRHAIVSGGETTVRVGNAEGRGGRNLEYLLGLAIGLEGAPGISALACDTDGIDGTEDAAGAMIVPDTLARAAARRLDPADHLARNDAYPFFDRLGDLVVTGPTLTNVNDVRIILVDRAAPQ